MEDHKEVTVAGWRYVVTHPDPETAGKMGIEISKLVGDSVAIISMAAAAGADVQSVMPKAIEALLTKIEPDHMMRMCKKVLSYVEIQGPEDGENRKRMITEQVFKDHFRGKVGAMITLTAEALSFQLHDFFPAIMDRIATAMKK